MNCEEWLKWREEYFRKVKQWEEEETNRKEKKRSQKRKRKKRKKRKANNHASIKAQKERANRPAV